MLCGLVPGDVIQRRRDAIYEVMGELAGIVVEEDGSSWSYSRKESLDYACMRFREVDLEDPDLRPKLKRLGDTWNSQYWY